MSMMEDLKEDIEYRYDGIKENIRVLGFWSTLGCFISGVWDKLIWNHVIKTKRIMQWVKILWNDRDWDHSYLLIIIKFKLERMKKALANGMAVEEHCKEKAVEIQEVLDVIKEIEENDFCKEAWALHRLKYGEIKFESDPPEEGTFSSRMHIFYEKTFMFEPFDRQAQDEAMNIHRMEEQKLQAAYHKMFTLIAKNIQGWWD